MTNEELIKKIDIELSKIKTDRDTHLKIFKILESIFNELDKETEKP